MRQDFDKETIAICLSKYMAIAEFKLGANVMLIRGFMEIIPRLDNKNFASKSDFLFLNNSCIFILVIM